MIRLDTHNPFAVRANPGGAIADSPLVFLKTLHTYLETTRAIPAKRFFLPAAMALIFTKTPDPIT